MDDLEEALKRARDGDPHGVEVLYRALAGPLLVFLAGLVRRREDAEDLCAQAFLEALRDLRTFDGDAAGFRAWLFRIGHNRAVDLGRRLSRRTEVALDAIVEEPSPDDPETEGIARLQRSRLWRAVSTLPPDQRQVIALRAGAGLSAPEIAEIVGKRTGAVKALQHRALANLARALRDEVDGESDDVVEPAGI